MLSSRLQRLGWALLSLVLFVSVAGAARSQSSGCATTFPPYSFAPVSVGNTAANPGTLFGQSLASPAVPQQQTITGVSFTGPDAAAFSTSPDLVGQVIPAGGALTFAFLYTGQHLGTHTATSHITLSPDGTLCQAMSFTGLAAGCDGIGGNADFGDVPVGETRAFPGAALAGAKSYDLTVTKVEFIGPDANAFGAPGLVGTTIPANSIIPIQSTFTPTHLGPHSATRLLTVTYTAGSALLTSTFCGPRTGNGTNVIHVQRLASVGTPVAATGRLSIFGADPPNPANDLAAVRAVAGDGSLSVLDYAGSALLRLAPTPGSPAQILLDTTSQALHDSVGLARLLRVETSPSGASAVLALRADNTRGLYGLEKGTLSLLAVLPEARGPVELAIGGSGRIAYVAPTAGNASLALFQVTGGAAVELLRRGQSVVNNVPIGGFSDLTSNEGDDLAVLVSRVDGSPLAVLRKRGAAFETVAATGQVVEQGRGAGVTGALTGLLRPWIGPDGTVVFQGAGAGFTNFYVARPGRPLEPLLAGTDWSPDPAAFDFEISPTGAVALRAARGEASDATLFYVAPTGDVSLVVGGRRDLQPARRPVFGPGNLLFFLAQNFDMLPDRNGLAPVGLFRYRPGDAGPAGVALPGGPVPGRPGAQLLSIPQRPAVSPTGVIFAALIGGPESLPVPTPALFQVPLGGALADGTLLTPEGAPVAGAGRLAILHDLSYTGDGTLVLGGLLPGAGSLIAPAPLPATTAGAARTQAAPADTIVPLVATGDDLGAGQIESTLPPLLSLGPDRELFAARLSQPNGLDREGLFTVSRSKQIELVAVTRALALGSAGALFNGLVDTQRYTLSPPSVAADGSVVFKALLDRGGTTGGGGVLPLGLFQWAQSHSASPVVLSDVPLTRLDPVPYRLEHWAAGKGGLAYFQARNGAGKVRLFVESGNTVQSLVEPGVTPVTGGTSLTDLSDFALNANGDLFVVGAITAGGGLFRLAQSQLVPVAVQGDPVPPLSDGRGTGLVFAGSFQLSPETARGELIFRATVQAPGERQSRRGSFRMRQGKLETTTIESVGVAGERTLVVDALADTLESQNGNGVSVSAYFTAKKGWVILRSQLNPQKTGILSEVIAQEGSGTQPSLGRFVALDAGPLLDREGLPPHSGPVFTIDEAGDVAFLASDGKSWGVYQVPIK